MLTVDFDRLQQAGGVLLDIGCGRGRHTFEAVKRGMRVVACDLDADALAESRSMLEAMASEEEIPRGASGDCISGDVAALPFSDGSFDVVIASEILEHIDNDERAMRELARVLKPHGTLVVTVPRWWPERICWALSSDYHNAPSGHVRIYRVGELRERLSRAGFVTNGSHHAHALHSPYWWLKCAFGVSNERALPVRLYHRFLVWDIMSRPRLSRTAERALNPLLGKSLVLYARKKAPHAS